MKTSSRVDPRGGGGGGSVPRTLLTNTAAASLVGPVFNMYTRRATPARRRATASGAEDMSQMRPQAVFISCQKHLPRPPVTCRWRDSPRRPLPLSSGAVRIDRQLPRGATRPRDASRHDRPAPPWKAPAGRAAPSVPRDWWPGREILWCSVGQTNPGALQPHPAVRARPHLKLRRRGPGFARENEAFGRAPFDWAEDGRPSPPPLS